MASQFVDKTYNDYYKHQTVGKAIKRNPMVEGLPLLSCLDPKVQTLHDLFMKGHEISKDNPCLGWRADSESPYSWMTYAETVEHVKMFASGLIAKGARAENDQFIGIFSQNRVEWKLTEQACNSYSMVIIPLYDTLGQESIEHIVTLCDLQIVVIDNNQKLKILLDCIKEGKFHIRLLIVMKEPTKELLEMSQALDVEVVTFQSVEDLGKQDLQDFVPPTPDSLHTICFTSGTTGMPKGAMLTHRNLVANICGVYAMGRKDFLETHADDVHISYLPLAHVFERVMSGLAYMRGARVGFFQGDIKLLLDDIAQLRPTIFPMVPRLINRMYDKIMQGANSSFIKGFLINSAHKSKLARMRNNEITRNTWWDCLVFKKVQNLFGGRCRICITGAAPISGEVLNFMRCALGIYFTEGYGQTESTAAISVSLPNDYFSGSVGSPALCNEVKLVDVPDMQYFAKECKGEVCVRGTNVFKGYYKNEEKTQETLDEDGWLHTGDIGMWLENGTLKIIDRKKNIFKLAQGEYIAPEKIEQILVHSSAVAQVYIHGESLKSTLVAIVVPDEETIDGWLRPRGVSPSTFTALCSNERVNKLILDDMLEVGKKKGLKTFELPRKIFLTCEPFSVENEMLTPTFKAKRNVIAKRYESQIKNLYVGLD